MKFTSGCIWGLTNDGKVYQWEIKLVLNPKTQTTDKKIGDKREIDSLRGSLKIAAGSTCSFKKGDHLLALNREGQVFAVGDDTFGQCGYREDGRNTCAPFAERRITTPIKVVMMRLFRVELNKSYKFRPITIIV